MLRGHGCRVLEPEPARVDRDDHDEPYVYDHHLDHERVAVHRFGWYEYHDDGHRPEVSASLGQTQGAAGTIIGTIDVTSLGSRTCTMEGYPTLTRFNAAGITITANIVHGLTVNLSGPASEPPALVTLAAGQGAAFDFEYSDVPTGEATSCPSSTSLSVTTPGALTPSPHFAVTMAPCDDETIAVSPVYAVSG